MSTGMYGRRIWRGVLPVLCAALIVLQPQRAQAHPLGNFTINRYSRVEVGRTLRLLYVVDMAEIPAFQEKARIDANQDGLVGSSEREQYLAHEAAVLQSRLRVSVNGAPIALQLEKTDMTFPPGQGGLQTQRLTLQLTAALPASRAMVSVVYRDDNFADRIGWQEVVVRSQDGARLVESDAPSQDVSNELRNYPQGLLQSPPTRHSATFLIQPSLGLPSSTDGAFSEQPHLKSPIPNPRSPDAFAALITIPDLGLGAILLALAAAFVWGGAHALTPGHGKTIVAAYLVGSRGTARHALFLGLTTTITHTAGVFALGLLTLFASRFIMPEQLYPWLGVLSGLMVVGIGLSLFRGRLTQALLQIPHANEHDHPHEHGHAHGDNHTHDHEHTQAHAHHHDHGDGHTHTHLPPGADGAPLTWRSLVALGVSGGLLPCPSALVVMLSAIALERIGLGLLLIVSFSLGLAAVLTAVGVLFVHAGRFVNKLQAARRLPFGASLVRFAPVASALFISAAGLVITYEALAQAGIVRAAALALP